MLGLRSNGGQHYEKGRMLALPSMLGLRSMGLTVPQCLGLVRVPPLRVGTNKYLPVRACSSGSSGWAEAASRS